MKIAPFAMPTLPFRIALLQGAGALFSGDVPGEYQMPKETSGQSEVMDRVMHEYKHGELESGNGAKVKSRKQAVAIALKEAGESKYESKSENRKNLAHTKAKERAGKTAKQQKEGHL
jgi:hypothetical protein